MDRQGSQPGAVDAYIAQFDPAVQDILNKIRAMILELAPGAEEGIRYQMPGYYLKGPLIYFAAFAHHIGLYPTPSGIEAFQERLAAYKNAKGSVQFPLDQPMPYELIRDIIKFRVAENLGRAKSSRKTSVGRPSSSVR